MYFIESQELIKINSTMLLLTIESSLKSYSCLLILKKLMNLTLNKETNKSI